MSYTTYQMYAADLKRVHFEHFSKVIIQINGFMDEILTLKKTLPNWTISHSEGQYLLTRIAQIFPIRFGELEVGDHFWFAGIELKKHDETNAVSLTEKGKQWFLFFRKDLVTIKEKLPHDSILLYINDRVKYNPMDTLFNSKLDLYKFFNSQNKTYQSYSSNFG